MNLQINTTIGTIQGFQEDGIRKFLGFPYASAPVGENRFRNAKPLEKQKEVIEAKQFSAKCPQLQIPVAPDNGLPHDEDCLYMNVWAPASCEKAPVFFWTTGGAFAAGEGSSYDGTPLVKRGDVIVVTYNYRVGVFGGFYPLNRYEGLKDAYVPNVGISDVLCALRFVHDNIAQFGGDPDNITIAGESAGAVLTGLLAGMKETQGLFSKVVLESFADMDKFGIPGRDAAGEFAASASLGDGAKLLEMNGAEIIAAQAAMCGGMPPMAGCSIVPDSNLMPVPIWDMIAKNTVGKAFIVGSNRDEAAVFVPPELADTPQGEGMKQGMTAAVFEQPTYAIADAAAANNRVYLYRFDYVPEPMKQMGAFHSAEMDYVFGTLPFADDEAQQVSNTMMDAWLGLMKNGDAGWTQYTAETKIRHHFDAKHYECEL